MKSEVGVNHQNEVIEVPRLRFIPFNKPWNKFKLKDVATFINGRAYKQNELLDSGKYRVLRVGNFFTNTSWYFSDLELDDKYYAEEGDLLYTWSASFGPHIWHGEKLIYHYHIWKIELSNRFDKLFATYLLDYDKEKILSDKNGSTMVHITKKGMEEKEVKLPSFSEQTKIGSFFKNLDDTISLYQQELEALKQTKQGFLQKMFPRDGENVPQIRFDEFTKPWTQIEFGKIIKLVGGATPLKENKEYWNGDIVWLSSQEIKNKYVSKGTYLITEQAVKDNRTKVVSEGTPLIVTRSGILAKRFPISISLNEVAINQDIKALIFDRESFDTEFVVAEIKSKESYILNNIVKTGTTVQSVNLPDLNRMNLYIPEYAEQLKIGQFFRQLDEVIELKEKELEALKETKKGFLQKMFV